MSCIIRVPIGAYGSGGPYHSSSVESVLANIKGIKIVYPSNSADMKGLMKAAYHDPNPVVMLEHKGLYWSKIKGTESAICPEPARDYILPLGKANVILEADKSHINSGNSLSIITYGMGVYWAQAAGLFVDPPKGPVLLNYGIDECRFTKPVYPGMTIAVRFTVKEKVDQEKRSEEDIARGIVKFLVDVYDDEGETVMLATILTMIKKKNQD